MAKRSSPVRRTLLAASPLQLLVKDGLGSLAVAHRQLLHDAVRADFADSLDIDDAFAKSHPNENRWDYLLGHAVSGEVVAVEPHSAKQDQVSTVVRKRQSAASQLAAHLRPGSRIAQWLWVASGRVEFADTETARRQLDQAGITFVGKQIGVRHLPSPFASKRAVSDKRRNTPR